MPAPPETQGLEKDGKWSRKNYLVRAGALDLREPLGPPESTADSAGYTATVCTDSSCVRNHRTADQHQPGALGRQVIPLCLPPSTAGSVTW